MVSANSFGERRRKRTVCLVFGMLWAAAHEKVYITSHGDVTPCNLVHDSYGNVLNRPLVDIIENMRKDPLWSKEHETCPRYLEKEFAIRGGVPI